MRATVGVTVNDVLAGACSVELPKRTDVDSKIVAACLRRLGWEAAPQSRRGGVRVRLWFPKYSCNREITDTFPVVDIADRTDVFDAPSDDDMSQLHGE
jgi:hypothetical protein